MATTKKQAFSIPFIGYDYGKDFNWDFDVLFGQYGNPIIGIKIKNIVEQYSADPDSYLNFHTVLNQVVSIIGEGRIVQKLDIFPKKNTPLNNPTNFYNKNIRNILTADFSKPSKRCFCLQISSMIN
ncbi:Uncharacterised protein [Chryseobacterium carnipullorum]|uniref:Uncharacterized protein n=1 Tax=Chryseobacterium carnipullorum TaxID=1124835 RepID=A0A376E8R3_CHRCU|nr:Uncharacterised protein [Chryseobacterium carnipullorum]